MQKRGVSKKQFADALGKRPCEVAKWLSGQHSFTIATFSMLSTFFVHFLRVTGYSSFMMKNSVYLFMIALVA